MFPFAIALVAGIGFFLAAKGAATGIGRSLLLQRFSMLIAAGILLGVTFADLMPEALEMTTILRFGLSVAAGFILLYAVETLSGGHTHHHEPHEGAHAHTHGHAHAVEEPCVPTHPIRPFLLGLGFHNFADGLVIGIGGTSSDSAATAVAIGILIHQLPVGLSFAAVLQADGRGGRSLVWNALVVAVMIPLGTVLVLLLPDPSNMLLGTLLAVAAGALLYVATGHLLPEAHSEDRSPSAVAAFAIALAATVWFIGSTDHGHEHDHADDAVEHHDEEHLNEERPETAAAH